MVAYICTEQTITLVLNGEIRTIQIKSKAHRNETLVAIEKYKRSAQTEKDLANLKQFLTPINRIALQADSRLEFDDKAMYLKGTTRPIPSHLSNKMLDFINSGLPIDPLVKFWESCLRNPHYIAVNELFNFLEENSLPITDDGAFLGYKKLNLANRIDIPDDFEELVVNGKGKVININGKPVPKAIETAYLEFINEINNPVMKDVYSGKITQKLGDFVKIPRVKLNELDRRESCGYGLHVGSFDYSFSGNVRVLVKVFPEDVIACNEGQAKLRTCRYQIISFIDSAVEVKQALIDLKEEEKEILATVKRTKNTSVFTEGQEIKCTFAPDRDLKVGNKYTVLEVDDEDVLIVDERGQEEWYDENCFL